MSDPEWYSLTSTAFFAGGFTWNMLASKWKLKKRFHVWLAHRTDNRQARAVIGTFYGCTELYGWLGTVSLLGIKAIFASLIQVIAAILFRRK